MLTSVIADVFQTGNGFSSLHFVLSSGGFLHGTLQPHIPICESSVPGITFNLEQFTPQA
jgi:hypothetical protein